MKTYRFVTNLKCQGCVDSIKQVLDNDPKIESWNVDLEDKNKILTVTTDLPQEEIIKRLQSAGYEAKPQKKFSLFK